MPTQDAPNDGFPTEGRLAAVDFGTVRIGIAICDPDWILASPLEIRPVSTPDKDAQYFADLARSERIAAWVVGLPIHCDGGESDKSKQSREFAKWLHETTGLPTRLFDERFTTVAANAKIRQSKTTRKKTKQRVDAVAAQVLLESFLESCRYRGELAGVGLEDSASDASLDDA
ncbi:Holliday junction resolvase RuvX [Rhodopirellula sp. JC740]|uniref:Putative pre-16S rRNA nuclease n=1 Tax=Rhodopirellula halodulae TaxID=2894198 RepID=A0ABS8NMX7_9BACT|nr:MULTISPECIES: Holliday junction resolvase RuvX [unclassified Rhodopirellula]MCC9644143.1 Holliday junction resolvase RuvX [Rhodopirellula sp. JC740]MCC9657303.1 Holliday junction resolvase RuvX [Rhodopirellula sp. JC737]